MKSNYPVGILNQMFVKTKQLKTNNPRIFTSEMVPTSYFIN